MMEVFQFFFLFGSDRKISFLFLRDSADLAISFIDMMTVMTIMMIFRALLYHITCLFIYCNIITKESQRPENTTQKCIKKKFRRMKEERAFLLAAI